MSRPEDRQANEQSESAARSRWVYRTAIIFIAAPTGMLLHYASLLGRYEINHLLLPMSAMLAVIISSISCLLLNRKGHTMAAARILVGNPLVVAPVVALSLTDAGFVLGVAATVASVQIASLTLPRKQMNWVIPISIIVGVSTILLNLYWRGERLVIPEDRVFVPVATCIVILVLGFSLLRQFGSYPIRTKLLTASFIVAVLGVGATTYFANRTTSDILTEKVSRELNSVAESQALAVGQLLGRQTGLLQLLSQNQLLQLKAQRSNALYPLNPGRIREQLAQNESQWATAAESDEWIQGHLNNNAAAELKSFQAAFPAYTETILTDRYGALQASTNRIPTYYQANEEWWQSAYDDGKGAIYISRPRVDETSGNLALDIAVPLNDLDASEVVGVLRATYSVKDLTELLASTGELGQSINLLLPSDATLSAGEFSMSTLPTETVALLEKMQDDEPVAIEFDGEQSMVSQATVNTLGRVPAVDALGWTIIAHQNQVDSLAVVAEQQRTLILIGMAVLVVASATAIIFSQTLTRPIVQLTDVARQVAAGDLSVRAPLGPGDEAGILAKTFNDMTTRLQETLANLEQRVAERTRVLETSMEVSRSLSNILDPGQLIAEVVEQIQSAFGYYHAHIYLVEESSEDLVLAGGTGEAGKEMLRRGHRISKGNGLVGRAAMTNGVVLASDVTLAEGWLPNPLLPDTKAEIAAPIAIGEQVMGVIDVQNDRVDGLTDEDARLLQSVSSQVAIALRNASLFEQTQQKAEREAKINAITLKIRDANSVEDVLQIAAQELGKTLQTRRASVQLRLGRQPTNGHEIG